MDNLKIYKKLTIPEDSAFGRPYKWYQLFDKFHSYMINNHQSTKVYKILDFLLFTPVYNIHNGLINFKNWYKIIWKDRNYDHHFIYVVLQHKLELIRNYQVAKNRHYSIDQTNKYITICLNLIERIKDEYYGCEYIDYIKSNFSFKPTGDGKTSNLEIQTISENLDDYLFKYKSSVKFVKKKYPEKDFSDKKYLAMFVSSYNEDKAKKLLYKILEVNLHFWWD